MVGQWAGAVDGGRRVAEPPAFGEAARQQLRPAVRVGLVPGGQPVADPLAEDRDELVGGAGVGEGGQGVPPAGQVGQGRFPGGQARVAQPHLGPALHRVADPQAAAGLGVEHGGLAHPAGEAFRVGEVPEDRRRPGRDGQRHLDRHPCSATGAPLSASARVRSSSRPDRQVLEHLAHGRGCRAGRGRAAAGRRAGPDQAGVVEHPQVLGDRPKVTSKLAAMSPAGRSWSQTSRRICRRRGSETARRAAACMRGCYSYH